MGDRKRDRFSTLLVPLDGSENAERALGWVTGYARAHHSTVHLLTAVNSFSTASADLLSERRDEAESYLDRIERTLRRHGIESRSFLGEGHPVELIARHAIDRCDLVVLTTRGASAVGRWLLGSVPERISRILTVPLLIVPSAPDLSDGTTTQRIVVPLDGSAYSAAVLPRVEHLAAHHKAALVLLHVETRESVEIAESLSERMHAFLRSARERKVRGSAHFAQGDPAETILSYANRRTDMIAMSTRGLGGIRRLVLGSVASKVLHHSPVPVYLHGPASVK